MTATAIRTRQQASPAQSSERRLHFELAEDHHAYSSATGPNSGGGMRCFVAASYAEAIRRSVGSEKGLPKNMTPSGSFAGIGPTRRVPPGDAASRTLSNTCVVKPIGTDSVGKPCCPKRPQTELVLPAKGSSMGAPRI